MYKFFFSDSHITIRFFILTLFDCFVYNHILYFSKVLKLYKTISYELKIFCNGFTSKHKINSYYVFPRKHHVELCTNISYRITTSITTERKTPSRFIEHTKKTNHRENP